jgi:hypothetical protein
VINRFFSFRQQADQRYSALQRSHAELSQHLATVVHAIRAHHYSFRISPIPVDVWLFRFFSFCFCQETLRADQWAQKQIDSERFYLEQLEHINKVVFYLL